MMQYFVDVLYVRSGGIYDSRCFDSMKEAKAFCLAYNSVGSTDTIIATLREEAGTKQTSFQRVAEMNTAFGNPKGDAENIDWSRIRSQCKNIHDEYCELLEGFGLDKRLITKLRNAHSHTLYFDENFICKPDTEAVRDALCDIQVFAKGAQHLMGYDGDNDMDDVVDGVMSRFVKDEDDKLATILLHAGKGVTEVYFEGEYPKMVMKSAVDQPDAPKGKFLKSASYVNTVFRPAL